MFINLAPSIFTAGKVNSSPEDKYKEVNIFHDDGNITVQDTAVKHQYGSNMFKSNNQGKVSLLKML